MISPLTFTIVVSLASMEYWKTELKIWIVADIFLNAIYREFSVNITISLGAFIALISL